MKFLLLITYTHCLNSRKVHLVSKMLKNGMLIVINLFLLTELTVCQSFVERSDDSTGIPCKMTNAETLFKVLFVGFLPAPPNNSESQARFNKAKGAFRAIFPGKKMLLYILQ